MYKICITDHEHDYSQIEAEILSREGATVVGAHCKTERDVIDFASDADGIMVAYAPITQEVVNHLKHCRVIVRYGVGVDNIDVGAATQKHIFVTYVPDYCIEEVATHTIALMLCCARRIAQYNKRVREHQWGSMIAGELNRLSRKKLGLLGFGRIGSKVAALAGGLGLQIHAHDPYVSSDTMEKLNTASVDLETLFSQSDYLSIHIPLVDETRHFVDQREIGMMKKTAFLINTARGGIVNQKALIDALTEKRIAGAALDTFEIEPPEHQEPLLKMENVVLTPHAAWYSEEANQDLRSKAAEEVARVLRGEIPKYLINRDVLRSSQR
jgi:D-3-phosphoglycerate dehydrogenase